MRFRTPTNCQNGHFAWLYWEVKQMVIVSSRWDKRCKCPSSGIGEEWGAVGPDQQCTELRDRRGQDIYEGDIVQRHPTTKYHFFMVLWSQDEGWGLPSSIPPTCDLIDFEVVGNGYETAIAKGV